MSGRSPTAVLDELLALSPQGDAMPTTPDTTWAKMLAPLANEFSLVEALMLSFMVEINPLTAVNLLADYERVLGPDPYGRDTGVLSIQQRQQLAYSRWTGKYGVRPADFIALAASFGETISIQQFQLTTAGAFAGDNLVSHPTQFAWLVQFPTPTVTLPEASSAEAGALCGAFEPALAQPAIEGRAPAQTSPYFSYTG